MNKKYVDTSKLSVREIDRKIAKKLIVENHYSHQWTKCTHALGLFTTTGREHSFFDEPEEKSDGESDEKEFEPTIDMMMNDFDDESPFK